MKRVGFLFLNTLAHALHIAPIAFELSAYKKYFVTLYVSTNELKVALKHYSLHFPYSNAHIKFLKPSIFHRVLRVFKQRLHPRVRNVIVNNLQILLTQDAIVMTDKHMLKFKPEKHPLYIGAGHGAGDRAYGFSEIYKKYDFMLVSGKDKWDRMKKNNLITNTTGKIVGYPKFDITFQASPKSFFNNNKPVILYNPHFNRNETSWYEWGNIILDYFFNNQEFNLIFAPHIMLFAKNNNLNSKYYDSKNIHIDLDSKYLSDMTYTKAADFYLGDVSSQVYEFIGYKCRPCIFLNPHNNLWQNNDNFRMWNMGNVINDISHLNNTLLNARKKFKKFKKIQKKFRDRTFSFLSEAAGARAAKAIDELFIN